MTASLYSLTRSILLTALRNIILQNLKISLSAVSVSVKQKKNNKKRNINKNQKFHRSQSMSDLREAQ